MDVVIDFARECESELLYADDFLQMSETIEGLRDKFLKWKDTFESKGLKVNHGKTEVMVRSSITKDGLISAGLRRNWPSSLVGYTTRS